MAGLFFNLPTYNPGRYLSFARLYFKNNSSNAN